VLKKELVLLFFLFGCAKDYVNIVNLFTLKFSPYLHTKFHAAGWGGSPQTRVWNNGTPSKKTLFYHYWLAWRENGCR